MVVRKMKKVFLGGTCNNSKWRDRMIPLLNEAGVGYFNPVVENWTPECQAEEIRQRETCDFVLYTLTPKMVGVYSVAEVVDDSNKRPEKTIFIPLEDDGVDLFTFTQWKSIQATADMVQRNGAKVFYNMKDAAKYIGDVK